jgi:uncharacterized phage infection (PIP) family protein YhgE
MSESAELAALLPTVRGQQEQVVEALLETTTITQQGVLQAGEILGQILAQRQATADRLQGSLSTVELEHAPQIRAAVHAQTELVEAYVAEVTPLWDEALRLVAAALECTSEINQCAANVAQVSKAMGVLQMCCKSEIAHLGEAALSFRSTVVEMQGLTQSTDALNRRLERLSSELSTDLPPIAALTTSERRRTRSFHAQIRQSLAGVEQASESLVSEVSAKLAAGRSHEQAFIAASYAAISALQFQDPLVQDLQRIDSRLGEFRDLLDGLEPDDERSFIAYRANVGDIADEPEDEADEASLEGGEFLLF